MPNTSGTTHAQAAPKSWRDVLPIHPAAELFPLMAPDEIKALGEDIKKNGLRIPCRLIEDKHGNVALLDGRNRLDAIELIGAEITLDNSIIFERFVAEVIDPIETVISLNIHRRHLTAEQKRKLIAELIKTTPEKSDRQIAETVKASPTTVRTVRAQMEARGEVSKLDTRTDAKGVKQPAAKPAHARGPTHVCWQCGRRGKVGEVQEHHYACYEDVWLHDACVSAFDQAEQQRGQARVQEQERKRERVGREGSERKWRSDTSGFAYKLIRLAIEIARELHRVLVASGGDATQLMDEIAAGIEIEEAEEPLQHNDGIDIPPWLQRSAP